MKIKPLADRLVVKQVAAETKTAGGLIIPDTAVEKTQIATVEEVGPGTEKDKMTVKVGDKILFDKYTGTNIKVDGEDYLILKIADVLAIVE